MAFFHPLNISARACMVPSVLEMLAASIRRVAHSPWITLKTEAPVSSDTLITICQSQWHHVLEDLTLHGDEIVIPTEASDSLLLS
jgi:hypothetical protein